MKRFNDTFGEPGNKERQYWRIILFAAIITVPPEHM